MKAGGFVQGVGVALAMALGGSVAMFALAGVVAGPVVLSAVVTLVGLGYVLYLLAHADTRVGKVSAVLLWALLSAVTLALGASLIVQLCVQVGLIWLLRAFCIHRSVLPALADLALCAFSVLAALWAADRTGSVFLSIWFLLLVQSTYVAIPRRNRSRPEAALSRRQAEERFARAHRAAQAAVRRLCTVR